MKKENDIKKYEKELKIINDNITVELHNLKYLINHINIENIDLLEFHYKFIDLFNKRKILIDKLFNLKFN